MHQQVRGFTPVHRPFIGLAVYPLGFAPLLVCTGESGVKPHLPPASSWSSQLSDCCSPTLLTRERVGIVFNHLFKRVLTGVARIVEYSTHLVQHPI